jgi:transposase-like protein
MKRRKWSSEQKLKIVLEGLSGQIEISKLCNLVTKLLRRKTLPRKKKGYKTKINN